MRKLNSTRVVFAFLIICALLAVRAKSDAPVPSNIRITPPAPVFSDKDRVAELMQRRERVAQNVGPQSLMILFSGEPRVYANDVDYAFRQENNLLSH